jgi:cytosine/adenosine deaminase-related metal-dependent hydrolase
VRVAGCAVLDAGAPGGAARDKDILIVGDRIAAIAPAGTLPPREGERVVAGSARLAVPGLVNSHTHSPENLLRGISSGAPLERWLIEAFTGRHFGPRELELAALLGAAEMLGSGVTAVVDHVMPGAASSGVAVDAVVCAYVRSGLRVALAPMLEDRDLLREAAAGAEPAAARDLPPPMLSTDTALALLEESFARWDGAGDGRIHVLAGPSSLMWASDRLLERCAELAATGGRSIHIHAAETWLQERLVAERFGESTVQALDRRGLLGPRTSLAHCVWIEGRDLALLAERGAVVIHNPVSNLRLGSGVAPLTRMLAEGISVAIGTDGAASNDSQDLPEALKLAALLANRSDAVPAVAEDELLAMATSAGARAGGWDDGLGRLAPGGPADLALLGLDSPAFAVLNDAQRQWIFAGGARAARTVIVAGRVVFDDGAPTAIDVHEVAAELSERATARGDAGADQRRAALAALARFLDRAGWTRPQEGP